VSARPVDVVELRDDSNASETMDQLLNHCGAAYVLVRRHQVIVDDAALSAMLRAFDAPIAATSSPVPSSSASTHTVRFVDVHERLPPPASMAVPCLDALVIARQALRSIVPETTERDAPARDAILGICYQLLGAGWRHVTAPGAALKWNPAEFGVGERLGGWSRDVAAELAGPANAGLATQILWTDYSLRSPRIIVDGACLTDAPHTGSQKLVVHVTQSLKRVRPAASVTLAVHEEFVDYFRRTLADVDVVTRTPLGQRFDVVYRPYQLIDPAELPWLASAAQRLLLGQLDMIGFSNPSYHPSPALFHAVRNLQRRVLRLADGVTFISDFSRRVTVADCPDLDQRRLFVTSCGADSEVPLETGQAAESSPLDGLQEFVLCLSATFSHKNRPHAVRVFEQLCRRHGFRGSLVIAGPEPFYGRSTEVEQRLIDAMPASMRARIIRVGQVDEHAKWVLLRRARLVLYPSVVEGFGLVPFEAAAAGTPSLGYAGSGLVELLEAVSCLMPSWSVDEWAQTAYRLITDEQWASDVVTAINRSARVYTWERAASLTWDALDATVASPRAESRSEEGGWRSRVAPLDRPLTAWVRPTHLAHRVVAYASRRLRDLNASGGPG